MSAPRIVVVGDVLLDIDLDGTSDRLAPDAPVPVIDVGRVGVRAGGAGLAATLLAADGCDVVLVTAIGSDAAGAELRRALRGIALAATASPDATSVKQRIRAAGQPVARLDEGGRGGSAPPATEQMLAAIAAADAVLVADYGRGLTSSAPIREALAAAAARVPVVWDPHPRGADPVAGVRVVTPNLMEARGSSGAADPAEAARILRQRWQATAVAVTVGEGGAIVDDGSTHRLPATPVRAADPCGAGDRFASAVVAALADGADPLTATERAVAAAGAFLDSGGVSTLPHLPAVPRRPGSTESVRGGASTLVAAGGCFDLLHVGHVRTLHAARQLGDRLVVLLNSDASVRRLKGPARPLLPADERAELLLALDVVDEVIVFDEPTPERALAELRPDVWVKGGDYRAEDLPESALLAEWGGRVVTVPYHAGRSTTLLAAQLAAAG